MKISSFVASLICITAANMAYAETTEWKVLTEWFNTDPAAEFKSSSKTELLKDDFGQRLFDKPFPMTSRVTYKSGRPQNLFDSVSVSKAIIDCKHTRYAIYELDDTNHHLKGFKNKQPIIQIERKNEKYFDPKKSVPKKNWRRFDEDGIVFKEVCANTKGFSPDKVVFENELPGWKLLPAKQDLYGPSYLNKSDLSKQSLVKPFKLRMKRFKDDIDPVDLKKSSSYVTELLIDCKNKRSVALKTISYEQDYEYAPSANPKAVYTSSLLKNPPKIAPSEWSTLSNEAINAVGICMNLQEKNK